MRSWRRILPKAVSRALPGSMIWNVLDFCRIIPTSYRQSSLSLVRDSLHLSQRFLYCATITHEVIRPPVASLQRLSIEVLSWNCTNDLMILVMVQFLLAPLREASW